MIENDPLQRGVTISRGNELALSGEYLQFVVDSLRAGRGAKSAWIGRLNGSQPGQIEIVAQSAESPTFLVNNYSYVCAACEPVVEQGETVLLNDDAGDQYPDDEYFVDRGISSYCGIPLTGSTGNTIGLLALCDDRKFTEPEDVIESMTKASLRLAAEVESDTIGRTLTNILAIKEATDQFSVFSLLCEEATKAFGVSTAVIGEYLTSEPTATRILGCFENGQARDDFVGQRINIVDLPCKFFGDEDDLLISSDLQKEMPGFPAWSEPKLDSYAGATLHSSDHAKIGHFCIADTRSLGPSVLSTNLWNIFLLAVRTHLREYRLRKHERLLENLVTTRTQADALNNATTYLAHDIGNLTAGVLMTAKVASEIAATSPVNRHLTSIVSSAELACQITGRLIDQNEVVERNLELTRLDQTIEELGELLGPSIPASISIDYQLNRSKTSIYLDKNEILQLLLNLVGNSVNAVGRNDTVSISTGQITSKEIKESDIQFGHLEAERYEYLSVSDRGSGIEQERISDLFRFHSGDDSNAGGLGLLGVCAIVRRYNGAISFQSEVGRGTKVSVYFPIQLIGQLFGSSHGATNPAEPAPTVLVVDDKLDVRKVVSKMLSKSGVSTENAANADEANKIVDSCSSLKVVLLDVSMPETDGWTLLRQIRAKRNDLSFVMMSGYSEQKSQDLSDLHGVRFLEKPFARDDLVAQVESALLDDQQPPTGPTH